MCKFLGRRSRFSREGGEASTDEKRITRLPTFGKSLSGAAPISGNHASHRQIWLTNEIVQFVSCPRKIKVDRRLVRVHSGGREQVSPKWPIRAMADEAIKSMMTHGGISASVAIAPKGVRSRLMARVRSKDSGPEMAVRRALHARGLRYRLHQQDLPGRPDVVLSRHRLVVFIHGCFWHGCPVCDRGLRRPKSNIGFWEAKLASNRARDARNISALEELSWRVAIIWECTIRDKDRLAKAIDALVRTCESTGDDS